MDFFLQNSKTAAMVGVVGMVIGALGGAWVDNNLRRDREIERDLFRTRLQAIKSFLEGTSESFAAKIQNEKERKYIAKINYGRMLMAVAGDDALVSAMHAWIKTESAPPCPIIAEPSRAFFEMRHAILGKQSGKSPDSLVGEVALRCLHNAK